MNLDKIVRATALTAFALIPCVALVQSAPLDTITPAFSETMPDIPGKIINAIVVTYKPGGKSPPHRHARSAFVIGYVLSGSIRSQVNGGEVQVFRAGEHWTEAPGAHHDLSENASATEPASLLAIFIADTKETVLTTFDR